MEEKYYWYYCAATRQGFIDGAYDTDLDEFPISEILMYLMADGYKDVYIINQYPISKEEYDNLETALNKRILQHREELKELEVHKAKKVPIHAKGTVRPSKTRKKREVR